MLEDLGFYCIDNIPAALLKPFISYTVRSPEATYERTAIGLDARNTAAEIATVPQLIDELRRSGIQCEVIFLVTSDEELLRRFAETRRKHPMSGHNIDLREAMALERQLLEPIVYAADLVIDTSKMGVHGRSAQVCLHCRPAGRDVRGPLPERDRPPQLAAGRASLQSAAGARKRLTGLPCYPCSSRSTIGTDAAAPSGRLSHDAGRRRS